MTSDVVSCDVPLLLSRESLERAKAVIDFQKGELLFLGKVIPAIITKSGHYCLPLTRELSLENNKHSSTIYLISSYMKIYHLMTWIEKY